VTIPGVTNGRKVLRRAWLETFRMGDGQTLRADSALCPTGGRSRRNTNAEAGLRVS